MNAGVTYSLSSTDKTSSRTMTKSRATTNLSQTLHQPHTIKTVGTIFYLWLFSRSIFIILCSYCESNKPSSVKTKIYTVHFVAFKSLLNLLTNLIINVLLRIMHQKFKVHLTLTDLLNHHKIHNMNYNKKFLNFSH